MGVLREPSTKQITEKLVLRRVNVLAYANGLFVLFFFRVTCYAFSVLNLSPGFDSFHVGPFMNIAGIYQVEENMHIVQEESKLRLESPSIIRPKPDRSEV